jgi:CO dehydrogenase nickel-insertion accessory protein CooC1
MKIAITGGIGSGKSYVCRILEKHGIRVYDCDAGAKRLMRQDADLQAGLKKLVGEEVYSADGILRTVSISSSQEDFFTSAQSASILFSSNCTANLLYANLEEGSGAPSR